LQVAITKFVRGECCEILPGFDDRIEKGYSNFQQCKKCHKWNKLICETIRLQQI